MAKRKNKGNDIYNISSLVGESYAQIIEQERRQREVYYYKKYWDYDYTYYITDHVPSSWYCVHATDFHKALDYVTVYQCSIHDLGVERYSLYDQFEPFAIKISDPYGVGAQYYLEPELIEIMITNDEARACGLEIE